MYSKIKPGVAYSGSMIFCVLLSVESLPRLCIEAVAFLSRWGNFLVVPLARLAKVGENAENCIGLNLEHCCRCLFSSSDHRNPEILSMPLRL